MTTKLKIQFIVGLFFLMILHTQAQKKDVVWMHGLNGETDGIGLRNFANKFLNFANLDQSFAPVSGVKTANSGVKAIANFVAKKIAGKANVGDHGMIYVGHSLGGVVGKELDIRNSQGQANGMNAIGIITLGSPLSGAKIANSLESPDYRDWMFGTNAPINRFVEEITYNLGLPLGLEEFFKDGIGKDYTNYVGSLTLFGEISDDRGLFRYISLVSGNTWHDLKAGQQGHAHRRNVATATPKLNLWANIERPVFETMAQYYGVGWAYRGVIQYTEFFYKVIRWIPWAPHLTRRAAKANAYFNYTIHGRYTNLIADGISYEDKKLNVRTKATKKSCWAESRVGIGRACRGWGWFSWLCYSFVYVFKVIVCTIQTYFIDHEVWFQMPTYPDTDGVVSKASATAHGQRWKGTDIKVPKTNHFELVIGGGRSQDVLDKIFRGLHGRVPGGQVGTFSLK